MKKHNKKRHRTRYNIKGLEESKLNGGAWVCKFCGEKFPSKTERTFCSRDCYNKWCKSIRGKSGPEAHL